MGSSSTKHHHSHDNKQASNVMTVNTLFVREPMAAKFVSNHLSMDVLIVLGETRMNINKKLGPVESIALKNITDQARKQDKQLKITVTGEFVPTEVDMTPIKSAIVFKEPPVDVILNVECCFDSVEVCQQFMTFCMLRCATMNTRISEVNVSRFHNIADTLNLNTLRLYQDNFFAELDDDNMNFGVVTQEE